jgi:thiamine kinase-like enzyme
MGRAVACRHGQPGGLPARLAVSHAGTLFDRVQRLPVRVSGQTLCHWDVRNDNMLLRPDGQGVIFDWGMARIGPAWADEFCLSLEWAGSERIDTCLTEITQRHDGVSDSVLTDLIIAFAGSQAWRARQPAPREYQI